ncbi:hypothetical protein POM88_049930 [Heracleum sosnowskyi]|uniref:ELK domain-containing protein n=1 Tax=Heracleum sosnowskyi TaxID=360622 RepID=A0AAD8M1V6_9APIA|nr:hypothetical protein POM88_049930 [Heracleum sosnowskyi]
MLPMFKFVEGSSCNNADNGCDTPSSSSEPQNLNDIVRRRLAAQSSNLAAAPARGASRSEQIIALPSTRSSGSFPAMPKERKKNPLPPAPSPTKPPTIPVGESRKTSGHSGNMWKYIIGILSAVLVSVVALALFFFFRTRPGPDSQDTSVPWKTGLSGQLQKAFVIGVTLGEGTGATMSEDEDDLQADFSLDQSGNDVHDMMGFGPLLPTESERSLMERVRQELKIELKHGFRSKLEDVREEILRKRRAGKLPGDTTSELKDWWQQHSKWPYPTVGIPVLLNWIGI